MMRLVCLLEEKSAKVMLDIVLPKILPSGVEFDTFFFQGKQDLEKNIEKKLKNWQTPNTVFLIMRDQDSGDCVEIKNNLLTKVKLSGREDRTLVRIACHELESFYLGDLEAVAIGLGINHPSQTSSKYRTPDRLRNAKEELRKITKNKYQPTSGSRAISPHLKIDATNKSVSFNVLINGILKLIQTT